MSAPRLPATTVGRARLFVLGLALLATLLKLLVAAHTFGTNDVHYWTLFAAAVDKWGPVGIYGHPLGAPYNHPPLSGWMLVAANGLTSHFGHFPFWIRVPASVADAGTAVLVFELVRQRQPVRVAAAAGVAIAWTPL